MKHHNAANSTSDHPIRAIKTSYPAAMHQICPHCCSPAVFLDQIRMTTTAVICNRPAHLNFLPSAGLFEQSVHRPLMIIARGDIQSAVIGLVPSFASSSPAHVSLLPQSSEAAPHPPVLQSSRLKGNKIFFSNEARRNGKQHR
jgi:hypothetical protein